MLGLFVLWEVATSLLGFRHERRQMSS